MGYYYEIILSDFVIPKKKLRCAFNGVRNRLLAESLYVKDISSSSSKNLNDLLGEWGWEGFEDIVGEDLTDIGHTHGGKKYREYDFLILKGLSPYVETGSQLQCRGEDGDIWRWFFKDKTVIEQRGKIVFDDPE